jgi:drug/metabolite transporter (DMT)-like permease
VGKGLVIPSEIEQTERAAVKENRLWFLYAMVTVVAWGIWGAFIDTPAQQKPPFPETLGYVVWAFVMIPPALVALWIVGWKIEYDAKSIFWGCVAGFLGAGGQLILFKTLRIAPAYLVFPFVALSPVVTIAMALVLSKERATAKGWVGIALAVVAGVLLAYAPPEGNASQGLLWVVLASLVLLAWGVQGFAISHANKSMKAESIFFYMMLTSVLLIPVALYMTDFKQDINWSLKGPYLAAVIQILNSVGALLLVYAFRYGKAIIVSPLTNAGGPVITVAISLLMAWQANELVWNPAKTVNAVGIVLAVVATVLMAIEGEKG